MHRPDLLNSEIGSVSNRLKFKQVGDSFFAKPRIYRHIYRTYNANRSPGSWRMSTLRNSSWTIQNMSLHMGGLKIPLQTPVSTTCRFHCWNDQRSFIFINHLEHSAERRQGLLRPGSICLSQFHGQRSVLLFLQEVRWSEYWIVVIWFRTVLLWGEGKQTKNNLWCEGTSCDEKTIAPKCPLRSHNDMRRCRPNLTLSYCASSFSVSAIFLNFLIIFLLNWFSAAFLNFLTIFLSPWIADNLSHQVEMATCHGQGGEQDWAHTKEGKIIHKVRV